MAAISGRFIADDFTATAMALMVDLLSATLAIIMGIVLAFAVNPPIFFSTDFLPAHVNVAIAGLTLPIHRRTTLEIYIPVLVAFLVSSYSLLFAYAYVPYTWLHLVTLIILLTPIITRVPNWLTRGGPRRLVAIGILSVVGTMAQHLTGGLLYEFRVGFVSGISA
jgi:hypothetical protein